MNTFLRSRLVLKIFHDDFKKELHQLANVLDIASIGLDSFSVHNCGIAWLEHHTVVPYLLAAH